VYAFFIQYYFYYLLQTYQLYYFTMKAVKGTEKIVRQVSMAISGVMLAFFSLELILYFIEYHTGKIQLRCKGFQYV
jgi:hypothetical protein